MMHNSIGTTASRSAVPENKGHARSTITETRANRWQKLVMHPSPTRSPSMLARLHPLSMMVSARSRCSAVRSLVSSSWVVAIMPLSGVRISWLMLARNMDFASAALSAAT